MPDAQRTQPVLEAHASFDCDERRDLAHGLCAGVVRSLARRQEHVGMIFFDAANEVDLLQGRSRGMGRICGLERRPELRPHHAFAQARNVGVRALVDLVQIVGDYVAPRRPVDPDDPGEVIVAIDQRRAPEDLSRDRERISPATVPSAIAPLPGLTQPARRQNEPRRRRWRRAAGPISCSSSRRRSPWRCRPDFDRLMVDLLDHVARTQPPFRGRRPGRRTLRSRP